MKIEVLGLAPVSRPVPGAGCDYQLVGSIAELREYLRPAWEGHEPFGADWEATSLNTLIAQPAGLGVSTGPQSGRYVPVGHVIEPASNLPVHEVLGVLKACDTAGAQSLWYGGGAYDRPLMQQALGWSPQHWTDVIIEVFLVDSNVLELGLKPSALRFFGVRMQEISELDEEWIRLSKKERKHQIHKLPHQLPPEVVRPYGCDDAALTRMLHFHPEVQDAVRRQKFICQLEHRVAEPLSVGNRHGVYLDREILVGLSKEAAASMAAIQPQIWQHFGEEFSLSRKKYLAQKLMDLGLPIKETTKGGDPTAAVKVLEKYEREHPVVPLLIQWAKLEAQKRAYLDKLVAAHDYFRQQPWAKGRVRFAFGHLGVPTGRMKCGGGGKGVEAYQKGVADVNAQSIPDHEKAPYLPNTRAGFVAPPGFVTVTLDFSQIEMRIPANLSGEPKWIQTYQDPDGDIHVTNAQAIADVKEPGVRVTKQDKKRRGAAKAPGFAILYGGDEHTIARNASIPLAEAKQLLDAFLEGLPTLHHWMLQQQADAERTKMATTFLNRERHLAQYFQPEPPKPRYSERYTTDIDPQTGRPKPTLAWKKWLNWNNLRSRGHREAVNHPVQGGAADIFKTACVYADDAVQTHGWGSAIISPQVLWIHDELVYYVHRAWVTKVVPLLVSSMEIEVTGWPVPMKVEAEIGCRQLYLQGQQRAAEIAGDAVRAVQYQQQLDAVVGDETGRNSSWGETVGYDVWVQVYGEPESR